MSNIFWSKVSVAVQSALATAVTATGITKANPAVMALATGGSVPTNGDYVLLSVGGMHQLNKRVARAANANATGLTFELEGIDSSLYDTFASGSYRAITFGTPITTLTDVSPAGGDPEFSDTTTIHDSVRTQAPVISSGLTISATSKFDPSDAGLKALQAASESLSERAVRFTFANGAKLLFNGYISLPFVPTGQSQGLVTTPLTITADGRATVYAS